MAYTVFTGRDGQQLGFSWVTQKIGGVDAAVMVLDVNGSPLSTANPLPITAPSNLPVSVQGTVPVSIAGTVTVTDAPASSATVGTATISGAASTTLKTASGSGEVTFVSNSSATAGIWVTFGAVAAVVGTGVYIPPKANEPFPWIGEIRMIVETGGATPFAVGYAVF